MTTVRRFPKLLMATRTLSARTERLLPKTAVKNRLAVSSLEALIDSFGTRCRASATDRDNAIERSCRLTRSKVRDVCEEI